MSLDNLANRSLSVKSRDFTGNEFSHPFRVKVLKWTESEFIFPLEEECDRANTTLEGSLQQRQAA